MTEPHLDVKGHGTVEWHAGCGPVAIAGPYTGACDHAGSYPIAWGWDMAHYTLEKCPACASRAWMNPKFQATSAWLATDEVPDRSNERHADTPASRTCLT
jgi:hypothetical protein